MTKYQIALILTIIVMVLIIVGIIFAITLLIKKTIDYKCNREYEYEKFANADAELNEIKRDLENHNSEKGETQ